MYILLVTFAVQITYTWCNLILNLSHPSAISVPNCMQYSKRAVGRASRILANLHHWSPSDIDCRVCDSIINHLSMLRCQFRCHVEMLASDRKPKIDRGKTCKTPDTLHYSKDKVWNRTTRVSVFSFSFLYYVHAHLIYKWLREKK